MRTKMDNYLVKDNKNLKKPFLPWIYNINLKFYFLQPTKFVYSSEAKMSRSRKKDFIGSETGLPPDETVKTTWSSLNMTILRVN